MRIGFATCFSAVIILIAFPAFGENSSPSPNDPLFSTQWALHNTGQSIQIDIDPTHSVDRRGRPGVDIGWEDTERLLPTEKPPVIVAVLDSGIDATHPDLAGRVQPDWKDFLDGKTKPSDEMGHGTHIAGIIAANAGNGIGITGLTPSSVKILPIRVISPTLTDFSYKGRLLSDYAAEAILYAVDHGASIINMSFGWPSVADSEAARAAVQTALAKGALVVAAAGNDHKESPTFPCAYPGVVCVGAVSNDGSLSYFSNFGGDVDILAPGESIVSTYPTQLESQTLRLNGYERLNGTSQAAPMISAIAATLKAVHPEISLNELKNRILGSASSPTDLGDALYGVANLTRALERENTSSYLPQFKSVHSISLNYASGRFSGVLPIECFGSCDGTSGVTLTAIGSDAAISDFRLEQATGKNRNLVFSGKITGKNAPDQIQLSLTVSDGEWRREFRSKVLLTRSADELTKLAGFDFPKSQLKLMTSVNGSKFSTLLRVDDSFDPHEVPEYYAVPNPGQWQLIAPSRSFVSPAIQLPAGEKIAEVVKLDANLDGNPDYVLISVDQSSSHNDLVFRFYKGDLTPLYGSESVWRFDLTQSIGPLAFQSYGKIGAWIKYGSPFQGRSVLIPAFTGKGDLPKPDGYGFFRMERYAQPKEHYYFLEPGVSGNRVTLTARALDSATFYDQAADGLSLISPLNPSEDERKKGITRILFSSGNDFNQRYSELVVNSTTLYQLSPLNTLATHLVGASKPVLLSKTDVAHAASGFSEFFDLTRGRISWVDAIAGTVSFSDIQSQSPFSPMMGMIGYGSSQTGDYALVSSRFDLIAIQRTHAGVLIQNAIPMNRDTSFPGEQLQEMITPVQFSPDEGQEPQLGAAIDSTPVVGNSLATALWDSATGSFRREARYSIEIPASCAPMDPFDSNGLIYTLLCDEKDHWEFIYLRP